MGTDQAFAGAVLENTVLENIADETVESAELQTGDRAGDSAGARLLAVSPSRSLS